MAKKIDAVVNFEPRDYQRRGLHDIQSGGKKRAVWVWHRRAGKDKTALAGHCIPQMTQRVGAYYHWFPTAALGRKIIWDGVDKNGFKYTDHFPKELVIKRDEQQMKIQLWNGSLYQIVGTDKTETVGPNPVGNIFSEYALQNPQAYELVRPILAENDGWAIFCYTPRGNNHGRRLYNMAMTNPNWSVHYLTVDDTHAITQEAIDEDRASGMCEDLIQQEYYCSWNLGAEGAFYALAMADLLNKGHITDVPIDPHATTYTFWDLGIWGTAIWFVQFVRQEIRFVDFYFWHGQDLSHYAEVLEEKRKQNNYIYQHYAPHDVDRREFSTGSTTMIEAKNLGINFHRLKKEENVLHGIQRVMAMLPYCWFDSTRCMKGIEGLEQYHKEYNPIMQVYRDQPAADWSAHIADAIRYVSMFWYQGKHTESDGQIAERIRQLNQQYMMSPSY